MPVVRYIACSRQNLAYGTRSDLCESCMLLAQFHEVTTMYHELYCVEHRVRRGMTHGIDTVSYDQIHDEDYRKLHIL
jgi:hypothetical protein